MKITSLDLKIAICMDILVPLDDGQFYEQFLHMILDTKELNWNQKYFLLWQITGRLFPRPGIKNSDHIGEYTYKLYDQITKEFKKELEMQTGKLTKIPYERRTKGLVFVTVQQFLNDSHGPTKTTVDRALVLKRKLNKNVIIINTAEQYGGEQMELFEVLNGSYFEELLNLDCIEYEGNKFPFIQFDYNMPNIPSSALMIEFIKEHKPEYIVNIGGESPLMDVCAEVVDVLNVNTVPSTICRTKATYQVVGKPMVESSLQLLQLIGKTKEDILQGRFTWSLNEQTHVFSREMLGIPKDRKAIVVVGGRLSTEIDNTFIHMIDQVLEYGAVLVIIGTLEQYDEVCTQDTIFKEHSVNLGLQEDVLAILECCDIYVNPDRAGGGTSVIEAMYKNMPAVTLDHGDVALAAGKEFCVENYEQMQQQLMHYINDKDYYEDMAKKAKLRADYMLDSVTAFTEIIEEFEGKIRK